MIGLFSSKQAPRNNKRTPFQAPQNFLLALNAQFATGTDDEHDGAIVPFGDELLFKVLIDEGNQVGEGFSAACGCLGNDVLTVEDRFEAVDLDIG